MNWNTYQFHASGLKNLMITSRKKGELSETTKTYLNELYIREVYGREKTDRLTNKYMLKGIMCETDSLEMIERVSGNKYFKNQKFFENDYVCGTPDVVAPKLIDIKTSWDLWTFMNVDEDSALKDYYWQLMAYMWLIGKQESFLTYCLVDTPEELMNDDLYRLSFKLPEDVIKGFKKNYLYQDIAEEKRIKSYKIIFEQEKIDLLMERILQSRQYLLSINL